MKFAKRMDRLGGGIFSKLAEIKKEETIKGKGIIDLSIGVSNIPPAPHIMEALCKAAAEPSNHVYVISDRREVLEAISGWYQTRCGVELDPETEICSLLGSQEGLVHIVLSIVDEGDVVLVPDPCYPIFGDGPQIAGVRLHYMLQRKENGYITRLDEIPEDVARKVKPMVVSYPNNPITVMASDSFYEELIASARKYDIIVLHDNAYSDLIFDGKACGSFLRFPGAKEVGVESNSLSKTYGLAGVRIGFCLGNFQVAFRLKLLKSNMDCGILLPVQAAVIAAIAGGQPCVQATKEVCETHRNIMCGGFISIGWRMEWPEATMLVWAATPEYCISSEAFVMELVRRAGIMITLGSAFGPSGEGYVRLALVQDEEMLNKAIKAVRESGVLTAKGKRQMPDERSRPVLKWPALKRSVTSRPALNRWHVAILVHICFIYGNSLTPATISPQESGFFLDKFREVMISLGWERLWLTEYIVRKITHFAEYAMLGGLMVEACGGNGRYRILNRDVLVMIFVVPFMDETIQLPVAGRSGQISDVWLDMSGAAAGVAITVGAPHYLRRKKERARQEGRERI